MQSKIVKKQPWLVRLYLLPLFGKFVFSLIVFLFVLIVGYVYLSQNATVLKEKNISMSDGLKNEVKQQAQLFRSLQLTASELPEAKKQYATLVKEFPPESRISDLLADITKLGTQQGLKFDYFKPGAVVAGEYFSGIPVKISVVGRYPELAGFLSGIANLPNSVVVTDEFKIVKSKPEDPLFTLILTATLYYAMPAASDIK